MPGQDGKEEEHDDDDFVSGQADIFKHCQRHNGPKALKILTHSINTFSSKQKRQQALKSWSNFSLV